MKWEDPETWLILLLALGGVGGSVPFGVKIYRRVSMRPPKRRKPQDSLEPEPYRKREHDE